LVKVRKKAAMKNTLRHFMTNSWVVSKSRAGLNFLGQGGRVYFSHRNEAATSLEHSEKTGTDPFGPLGFAW
jgi:hypothetical protein